MDINTLKIFGAALIMFGFIYFILIRAINTKNYKRKSIYMFISGMILVLFFIGGIIYDIITGNFNYYKTKIDYFVFLIIAILYVSFFSIFYYIKGRKMKQKFNSNFNKKKATPTIKDKKEYVYIILKYNNDFLLVKDNDANLYKGIVLKFTHTDFFHDEIIKKYINDYNLNVLSYQFIGKAKKVLKKDNIYYCYKIILNEIPDIKNNFEIVDGVKLIDLPMQDDDKKIIYNSVVNDNFEITL